MRAIGITGVGYFVPVKEMTNKDLSKIVNTTDEWIFKKTGIKARRIAGPQEATSDLSIYACHAAMFDAGVNPNEIDLIILATSTPDMLQPSTAAIVQGKIGAYNAAAFDVSAVCAGFVFALSVADSMMRANKQYKKALVIGAETYSRILDWSDRTTCVFFGDGAGAVVLEDVPEEFGIKSHFIQNDGRGANVIKFLGGGSRYPTTDETLAKNFHRFEMEGKKVWDFAINVFPKSVREVCNSSGIKVENLNFIISHQANINIIRKCMEILGLPMSKTYTNIEKYGNTSGASIPIALAEAKFNHKIKPGDDVVFVGFGGGLSYGAVHLKWFK